MQRSESSSLSSKETLHVHENDSSKINRSYNSFLLLDAKLKEKTMSLSLWDFGGQEVFYTLHHLFMTKKCAYVLVFDMRKMVSDKELRDAERNLLFWLRSINIHSPESSVILVGTFLSEVEDQLTSINDRISILVDGNFKQILPANSNLLFHAIDNKNGSGVKSCSNAIENCARNGNVSQKKVPIRWMSFLDDIMKTENNYLHVDNEVREIGRTNGLESLSEHERALEFFHESGFIVYLTTTEILKNVVIVNPQWLIRKISKIIRDSEIHVDLTRFKAVGLEDDAEQMIAKGVVSVDLLDFLWEGEQTEFLVQVMKQAMLMSEWKRGDSYMVPSLLAAQPPPDLKPLKECHRMKIDFSRKFLIRGVFQMLVCLCVEFCVRKKSTQHSSIDLMPSFVTLPIEDGAIVHMMEAEDLESIFFYSENLARSLTMVDIVQSMMQKINFEVMSGGLKWEILIEHPNNNSFIR